MAPRDEQVKCPRARNRDHPCVVHHGPVAYAMDSRDRPICVYCEQPPKITGVPAPDDWDEQVIKYSEQHKRDNAQRLNPGKADMVTTPVTLWGPHGRAWISKTDAGLATLPAEKAAKNATLIQWVVEAPWAHIAWHSYCVVLIHLRPIDGLETIIYLEGATHEIWVIAMNPDAPRQSFIDTGIVNDHWLKPNNFAAQFIAESDVAALARVQRSVQEICNGQLSPDTDFMYVWKRLYGDNMVKDREDGSKHPPRR